MFYQKHVFVCTNERLKGDRMSCGNEHGMKLVTEFKRLIKNRKLPITARAQKCGCLDICESGPAVAIYPDAVFYGNVQLSDVAEIVESHIVNNSPVERIRLRPSDSDKQK